jgi:hypothetical protein
MQKTYTGSCHCGAVQFECDLDLSKGTTRCNCRFCRKARFWMAFAPGEAFRLLKGADVLKDYQRAPESKPSPFLHFQFCGTCGVRAFTQGGSMPGMEKGFHAISLACLDNATDEELTQAPMRYADGRHNDWGTEPEGQTWL